MAFLTASMVALSFLGIITETLYFGLLPAILIGLNKFA
jgi:hypothetical protein